MADGAFAEIELQRRKALIKAWEDNEKTKVDVKTQRKLAVVDSWENDKRASIEALLKQIEEDFEKKKAEYAGKVKTKMAKIHKQAEERKAIAEAELGKDIQTIQDASAKFRASEEMPKSSCMCFSY